MSSFADQTKRKLTAMGTIGDVGASYTVYEKNWICPQCKQENYASRFKCNRCRCRKPEGIENIVADPAFEQALASKEGQPLGVGWKETIDPTTQHLYYYNSVTGETRWDRPAEMGHAPMASGWFGRGAAGKATEDYNAKNKRYLTRPARKQKEFIEAGRSVLEGANEYNIWYGKYLGDHWKQGKGRDKAESRCNVETDAGYTKADKYDSKSKFFCIHFARGMCARGHECQYFHRIPILADDTNAGELHDCFGRERHANHRDDMDGVGSFTNPSRTLYVGGIQKSTYNSQEELERALSKHFGEWGEVEHINFVPRLSIAFIRFRLRTNCEFAKEAMSNQSLDGDENLNIKWAYDDPNPVAKEAIRRSDYDAAMSLIQAQGASLEEAAYDYPTGYQLPAAKRLCVGEGGEEGGEAVVAYPDTDGQYHHTIGEGGGGEGGVPSTTTTGSSSNVDFATGEGGGEGEGGKKKKEGNPEEDWVPVFDARYNSYYYFNAVTQETTWVDPGGEAGADEQATAAAAAEGSSSSNGTEGEGATTSTKTTAAEASSSHPTATTTISSSNGNGAAAAAFVEGEVEGEERKDESEEEEEKEEAKA